MEKTGKDVYNVNADETASFVAGVMEAEKFVFLTDVLGVMKDPKDTTTLISSMKREDVRHFDRAGSYHRRYDTKSVSL